MGNRRQFLIGGVAVVPAMVPIKLLNENSSIRELVWTTDLPTVPGHYLRRNPAVHSFHRCYVNSYMLQGEMNPIEVMRPPFEYFGPIPVPWDEAPPLWNE